MLLTLQRRAIELASVQTDEAECNAVRSELGSQVWGGRAAYRGGIRSGPLPENKPVALSLSCNGEISEHLDEQRVSGAFRAADGLKFHKDSPEPC
jgi:hypothetical protein